MVWPMGCLCIRRFYAAVTGRFLAGFAFAGLVGALLFFDPLDSQKGVFGVKDGVQRAVGFERARY